ncbi:MAG: putative lipid II flippase FtsW [Endomicrobium sp.]|jgi:cell division protein FtsW|uniref:putative lipid II flippase FtsW n=1 Tax=Candidatus Endomicrobiellum cubanum TaxID=3242325 RepID=UPI002822EB86|nr:putative lipid II flippase FtsW [Endomicrobium sp.]
MFKIDFAKYDYILMIIICICIIFGSFMVFSSSVVMADIRWASPYKFFIKQVLWVCLGFVAMFITSFLIDYKFYQKYSKIIYFLTLVFVVIVLFVGVSRLGAKRWLSISFFTVQPSEIAKVSMIIIIADFISRKKDLMDKWIALLAPSVIILLMLVPIALEPDLGTPILIAGVCFTMLFCAGIKIKAILLGLVSIMILMAEEIVRKPYRLVRFKDYVASFINIDASSYQVKQSLNALGSGGFFGKGIGKSQLKLMYLPEVHTDFIFPVIGEELGFVGSSFVIIFFMYIFFKGLKMSKYMPDTFTKYLCLGITCLIVFQAIINLSVTTGVFPAKGVPLPFISFGGTSLVSNMAAAGILINLSQYSKRIL